MVWNPHFDGRTYEADRDHTRLTKQLAKIRGLMLDGRWRTTVEIAALTGTPEPSAGARVRDLRKEKFGGYIVTRRLRAHPNVWEYRVRRRIPRTPIKRKVVRVPIKRGG